MSAEPAEASVTLQLGLDSFPLVHPSSACKGPLQVSFSAFLAHSTMWQASISALTLQSQPSQASIFACSRSVRACKGLCPNFGYNSLPSTTQEPCLTNDCHCNRRPGAIRNQWSVPESVLQHSSARVPHSSARHRTYVVADHSGALVRPPRPGPCRSAPCSGALVISLSPCHRRRRPVAAVAAKPSASAQTAHRARRCRRCK